MEQENEHGGINNVNISNNESPSLVPSYVVAMTNKRDTESLLLLFTDSNTVLSLLLPLHLSTCL